MPALRARPRAQRRSDLQFYRRELPLAAGTPGKRFALPNSRILIHQPWGGAQGQASDIAIQAKEILRTKDRLNQILAYHTKKPLDRIVTDSDRDFIMDAEQAKEYGVVDHVISRREK